MTGSGAVEGAAICARAFVVAITLIAAASIAIFESRRMITLLFEFELLRRGGPLWRCVLRRFDERRTLRRWCR